VIGVDNNLKMLDHLVINMNSGGVAAGFGLGFGIAALIVCLFGVWLGWKLYKEKK